MELLLETIVKPLPAHLFTRHEASAEMRWEAMAGQPLLTPTDRFFVRNHTTTPTIDASTWRLRLHGDALRNELDLTYDQLKAMPAQTRETAIECAGNGRRFYGEQQHDQTPGTQWGLGAIGVARWRGVPLRYLLAQVGISPKATDLLPQGLDAPFEGYGHVRRPLPAEKAMDDVLVAYEMNGEPLPPDHGFPVRLVVPGWVGIASIKWLGDIQVATTHLSSPWNTEFYKDVRVHPPKSAFELPWNAEFTAGEPYVLRGRSWSGAGTVTRVEVSTDEGRTWREARTNPHPAWSTWQIDWTPEKRGPATLRARATDESGETQPASTPTHPFGYHFNAVVHHPIHVR
ncbi:sulfite oxidase [Nonomuraea sp. NPDC050556]|uniref:sulfite oxidase n=1 Tax=Nonomuraea sp. NPDC050556 TaxID=3364369 RepID=UPI0037A284EF